MPFKTSKPFICCVGNPSFDPAKGVDDHDTHQAALELSNEKNEFEGAIRTWFGLPEAGKDDYVYHAVASVTLPQVQRVVEMGGENGLHGWYDGQGDPSIPDDIQAYTSLFSPSTSPVSSLKSFTSNARKDSVRSWVAGNLTGKRYLHPSYPGLVIPKVKNIIGSVPLNPYCDFWSWSCRNLEWCGPVAEQGLKSHHVLPVLMHHFGCVVPSHEALGVIRDLALGGVGSNSNRGSTGVITNDIKNGDDDVDLMNGNDESEAGRSKKAKKKKNKKEKATTTAATEDFRCGTELETVAVDNMQSEWRVTWINDTNLTTDTAYLKSLPKDQHKDCILLLVYPITGPDGGNGSFTRELLEGCKGDVVVVAGTQNGNGYTSFGRGKGTMDSYMEARGGWEKVAQIPLPSFAGRDEGMFCNVRRRQQSNLPLDTR
ncbi:hypothetical protein QBC40DRAFT_254944 [Triangularia verruculosa]|uniref:Uncharacterized protein n=1 Tax=Triangularia verruculosa TaxID=2587418 RepID=A0AAN6XFJ1_9PEZI|nr:hypothetical protein QBC40DRAFT_254944 [Triangularia verruculosa]